MIYVPLYTRVDAIIPWSELAEQSAAEQSLVYKNIDVISNVIAKQFRTSQAISQEF